MPDKFGDVIRLRHALDAIETVDNYIAGVDFRTFSKNSMMQDACIRQLQIIGEACGKISEELKKKYREIPWRQIVGLRIIVVHEYFGIDNRVIWDVIENDLPELKIQMEAIIADLG